MNSAESDRLEKAIQALADQLPPTLGTDAIRADMLRTGLRTMLRAQRTPNTTLIEHLQPLYPDPVYNDLRSPGATFRDPPVILDVYDGTRLVERFGDSSVECGYACHRAFALTLREETPFLTTRDVAIVAHLPYPRLRYPDQPDTDHFVFRYDPLADRWEREPLDAPPIDPIPLIEKTLLRLAGPQPPHTRPWDTLRTLMRNFKQSSGELSRAVARRRRLRFPADASIRYLPKAKPGETLDTPTTADARTLLDLPTYAATLDTPDMIAARTLLDIPVWAATFDIDDFSRPFVYDMHYVDISAPDGKLLWILTNEGYGDARLGFPEPPPDE